MLEEITRDERILAAAACNADAGLLAQTRDFPRQFLCHEVAPHVRPLGNAVDGKWSAWHQVATLPGGSVLISAIPVEAENHTLGFVVLVHDLSFLEQREAATQRFALWAFGFLALAASAITILVARFSWRGWSKEIRRLARGGRPKRPEFQPILQDVRDLVDRIMLEKETELEGGACMAKRWSLWLTVSRTSTSVKPTEELKCNTRRADWSPLSSQ